MPGKRRRSTEDSLPTNDEVPSESENEPKNRDYKKTKQSDRDVMLSKREKALQVREEKLRQDQKNLQDCQKNLKREHEQFCKDMDAREEKLQHDRDQFEAERSAYCGKTSLSPLSQYWRDCNHSVEKHIDMCAQQHAGFQIFWKMGCKY